MLRTRRITKSVLVGAMLAGAAVLSSSAAWAEGPSFPCSKASAPVEVLICNDGVLADQDQRLATAFSAARKAAASPEASEALLTSQRQWLKQRLTTCGIRPSGALPTEPEAWAWSECLSAQYDQRLQQLKAPPAPAVTQSPRIKEADFVHPACLDAALGGGLMADGEPHPIDLKACNAGHRHLPVEMNPDVPNAVSVTNMADGFPTWASYESIATLPSGDKLVISMSNGGGSGVFTNLVSYRVEKGMLLTESYSVGGDRCNGGLSGAALDSQGVRVSQDITPADLGGLMGLSDAETQDLPFCAVCCLGQLEARYTLPLSPEAQATPDVVRLESLDVLQAEEGGAHSPDACMIAALKKIAPSAPYTLTIPQVQSLKATYQACRKG